MKHANLAKNAERMPNSVSQLIISIIYFLN
jgi:hypothetical protein